MVGDISAATRTEVLGAIRNRCREASKKGKSRMLDEFVAIAGCHRKRSVRLLGQCEQVADRTVPRGQRIYDEAVRQALIVVWETSDGYAARGSRPLCQVWWSLWRDTDISNSTMMCTSVWSQRARPPWTGCSGL